MNWYGIHKSVVEKSGGAIQPHQVGEMTLSEVYLYLTDPKEVTPDGHRHLSDGEMVAEWQAWQEMGPRERLRAFQR